MNIFLFICVNPMTDRYLPKDWVFYFPFFQGNRNALLCETQVKATEHSQSFM